MDCRTGSLVSVSAEQMGQAESQQAAKADEQSPPTSSSSSPHSSSPSSSSSMASRLAEAAEYGEEANESIEAKARKALACPCIADLRNGPCGFQFSEAFLCYLKSTSEEKGSDCVHPFVTLQNCIKANPDAFSKDVLEGINEDGDETKKEEPAQGYKIYPPLWSKDPNSPKSKL